MNLIISGMGNVGQALLDILERQSGAQVSRRHNWANIVAVCDSKGCYETENTAPSEIIRLKRAKRLSSLPAASLESKLKGEAGIFVDLSTASRDGSRELSGYLSAIRHGWHIVTANKSPLANHWTSIMSEAGEHGVMVLFEATVAGGVPLFNFVRNCLRESRILRFRGVVSLTANYVLRQVGLGLSLTEAVGMAQKAGIAETDYNDDLMGTDAARKTIILANALFGEGLCLSNFHYEGVGNLMKTRPAEQLRNYRLITDIIREDGGTSVHCGPVQLPEGDFLLGLDQMGLGYEIRTDLNGTVRVSSAEDTPHETAAAVLNDINTLAGLK
ncbi:MAG TPA: homoserine dehydrogenase [Thermoplasmataceae archaeon]|nr:homoserine dehydrogenase [Thermoplasmataceae archaeon]